MLLLNNVEGVKGVIFGREGEREGGNMQYFVS